MTVHDANGGIPPTEPEPAGPIDTTSTATDNLAAALNRYLRSRGAPLYLVKAGRAWLAEHGL